MPMQFPPVGPEPRGRPLGRPQSWIIRHGFNVGPPLPPYPQYQQRLYVPSMNQLPAPSQAINTPFMQQNRPATYHTPLPGVGGIGLPPSYPLWPPMVTSACPPLNFGPTMQYTPFPSYQPIPYGNGSAVYKSIPFGNASSSNQPVARMRTPAVPAGAQSSFRPGAVQKSSLPAPIPQSDPNDVRSWNKVYEGVDNYMKVNEEIADFVGLPAFRNAIPRHYVPKRRHILEPSLCLLKSGKRLRHARFVFYLLAPPGFKQVTCDGGYTKNVIATYAAVARNEECVCDGVVLGKTEEITPSCLVHELIGAKFGLILAVLLGYQFLHLVLDNEDAVLLINEVIYSLVNPKTTTGVFDSVEDLSDGEIEDDEAATLREIARVKAEVLRDIRELISQHWVKDGYPYIIVDAVLREGNFMVDNPTHLISAMAPNYKPRFMLRSQGKFFLKGNDYFEFRDRFSYYIRYGSEYKFVQEKKAFMKKLNS